MRGILRWTVSTIFLALCSLFVLAQGNNPPMQTKEAGQTSGHGMTAIEEAMPSANVEQQIKSLDEQARQAALKGDSAFLEKYLAPDYVGINETGKQVTRDQAIQSRNLGAMKLDTIDIRDTKIRLYGNTAVVTHDAFLRGMRNGQPFSGEHRATFVWVKQGRDWKLASFEDTPVQAPSAASNK